MTCLLLSVHYSLAFPAASLRYNELDRSVDPAAAGALPAAAPPGMQIGHRLADSSIVRTGAAASASAPSASAGAPAARPVSISPTAAQSQVNGPKRFESPQEAAIRAQRAAALGKGNDKKAEKDAANREARWQAYSELETKAKEAAPAAAAAAGAGSSDPALSDTATEFVSAHPSIGMSPYFQAQMVSPVALE